LGLECHLSPLKLAQNYLSVWRATPSEIKFLNYTHQEVNFENLLLTLMAQKVVLNSSEKKIGLTIPQFFQFMEVFDINIHPQVLVKSYAFTLNSSEGEVLLKFVTDICREHFSGLVWQDLKSEELNFVGGVLILESNPIQ
jgi:hypothetical protein